MTSGRWPDVAPDLSVAADAPRCLSPRAASACASGRASFMVAILPLRSTSVAGARRAPALAGGAGGCGFATGRGESPMPPTATSATASPEAPSRRRSTSRQRAVDRVALDIPVPPFSTGHTKGALLVGARGGASSRLWSIGKGLHQNLSARSCRKSIAKSVAYRSLFWTLHRSTTPSSSSGRETRLNLGASLGMEPAAPASEAEEEGGHQARLSWFRTAQTYGEYAQRGVEPRMRAPARAARPGRGAAHAGRGRGAHSSDP